MNEFVNEWMNLRMNEWVELWMSKETGAALKIEILILEESNK